MKARLMEFYGFYTPIWRLHFVAGILHRVQARVGLDQLHFRPLTNGYEPRINDLVCSSSSLVYRSSASGSR